MPTLTQFEYLVALNKERHFARAAELCHVSQPSLSLQIQKLEEEYGVIIFDRSQSPVLVTEIGAEIIKQAQVILSEAKKLAFLAKNQTGTAKGELHLAVIPTVAPYLIPLFLHHFAKNNPLVHLKISEHKTNDIIKLLLDDEIDAAILSTPLNHNSIVERHLYFEPFSVFLNKKHPLSKLKNLKEEHLQDLPLWLLEEGHCMRSQVLQICQRGPKQGILSNVQFTSGQLETLKNLVLMGEGATLLPQLSILNLTIREKELYVRGFGGGKVPTREIGLVHSRTFYKESILNALETSILSSLPKSISSIKKSKIDVIKLTQQ